MSGIYISGMEMPKEGCHHIICIYADGTVATGGKTYRAVPVPDHGRLVDADALMKNVLPKNNDAQFKCVPLKDLVDAPTIIPASMGDENG